MSALFKPLNLGSLSIGNRVVVSPMCQYSAKDGSPENWHLIHLGQLALSGAGLLIVEATAVEPEGRISPFCLGLYSDKNEVALGRIIESIRVYSEIPIGIQLAHAGRKASTRVPWHGRGTLGNEEGCWQTVAPSPSAFGDLPVPMALDRADMIALRNSFVQAAQRARQIGIDLIEIHAAHGYLLSQYLSPLANQRTDQYGGSLDNRMRYPLEVFDAVRETWANKPLGVRMNATDWSEGGITVTEAITFAATLAARGCDYACLSSGGNALHVNIPIEPGYQVPFAETVRANANIPTMAVGLILDAKQAESIILTGKADAVALARGFIDDPRWVWHAAQSLGVDLDVAKQYERALPHLWPGAEYVRTANFRVKN